ncbi:unnamed protein product, partial [Tilletia laevis]
VATKGIIRNKDVIRPKKTVRFAPLPPQHVKTLAREQMRLQADLEHVMRIPRPSRYNFAVDQPRPKVKKTVRFAEEPMAATSNYATKISVKRLLIRSAVPRSILRPTPPVQHFPRASLGVWRTTRHSPPVYTPGRDGITYSTLARQGLPPL